MSSGQKNTHESGTTPEWSAVTSIPLSEEGTGAGSEQSLGSLVRDASAQVSTLIRAEVELAKSEIAAEAKKAIKGGVYFVLALTVLCYSLTFFFLTGAAGLIDLGLWRWASFGIVFLVMLLITGIFGWIGMRKVKKIQAPKKTIASLKDTTQQLTHRG